MRSPCFLYVYVFCFLSLFDLDNSLNVAGQISTLSRTAS
jgi:hypothetical protein